MEENKDRIDRIYRELSKKIVGFRVQKKVSPLNAFRMIHVLWHPKSEEGFGITCPRDLDTTRYLCEYCLIDPRGALYQSWDGIDRLSTLGEVEEKIYRFYFSMVCLNRIGFQAMRMEYTRRKRGVCGLQDMCLLRLSTVEQAWYRSCVAHVL